MTRKSNGWGGRRPGAGRPRKRATAKDVASEAPKSVKRATRRARYLPLDYMLEVMNDETVDLRRRARMAVAAAPFFHTKIGRKAQP